ncbi:hypothetical protein ACPW96_16790 [Micromonospora sp. DT81.3]|uniref:hypothetical protein n=1 Tax=Micromonospora sp. DT81.3 TaxID=3416523 RepID=UPI003CEA0A54
MARLLVAELEREGLSARAGSLRMSSRDDGDNAAGGAELRLSGVGRFIAEHTAALIVTILGTVVATAIALWLGLVPR